MKLFSTAVRNNLSRHFPTVIKPLAKPAPFSVAEIVADFEAKIKQLSDLTAARQVALESNKKAINLLLDENIKHANEAERAKAIGSKLQALLA
jgi:hypothetical protein